MSQYTQHSESSPPPPGGPSGEPVTGPPQQPAVAVSQPSFTPTVTYVLLGLTVLVYLAQILTGEGITVWGLKENQLIAQGQFWRLITPTLLHGSILHLGFNMYALFVLGPGLERYYGHGRFLALYLLSGFTGNVLSMIFSAAPSLGSSTAIFGLLGAQGVFVYQNRVLLGAVARRALVNIVVIAAINLFIGTLPQIDNWGHIGGLIGGALFAWFGGPKLGVRGTYPEISVEDERSRADMLRAGIIVWLIFALLAGATIAMRIT